MVPAKNYDTFADAILKKLITEIASAASNTQQSSSITLSDVRLGSKSGHRLFL
jgi:hypothetical protein